MAEITMLGSTGWLRGVAATALVALLAAAPVLAQSVVTRVEDHEVRGYDAADRLLWRVPVDPESGAVELVDVPGGVLLRHQGVVIDASGRLRSGDAVRSQRGATGTAAAAAPLAASWLPWQPVVPGDPPSAVITRPDGAGNVVALISSNSGGLSVASSIGATGAWGPPEAVVPADEISIFNTFAVDRQGNITVVWRSPGPGCCSNYQVRARRYTVGVGWGADTVIDHDLLFFQRVQAVTDARGDVVVIYDKSFPQTSLVPQTWSVVYNAALQAWSPPRQLSNTPNGAGGQALAASDDGNHVSLLWAQGTRRSNQTATAYSAWFDTSTLTWSTPKPVVGLKLSGFDDPFPAVVDRSGTATYFLRVFAARGSILIVALRGNARGWQTPTPLVASTSTLGSISGNHAAVAPDGSVYGGAKVESPNFDTPVYAFVYRPATGGWVTTVLEEHCCGPAKFAVHGNGAIAVYTDGTRVRSGIYDGSAWVAGPDLPPGHALSYYDNFVTTSTGDANFVLYFDAVSTWFRP